MIYIKQFFKIQSKTTIPLLLLFSFILLLSCGDDNNNNDGPAPNYDGVGSVKLNYKSQGAGSPYIVEATIYDQNDKTLYATSWISSDFDSLLSDSENNPIIFRDIPAGPQRKLVVIGKDLFGPVISRGEKETFSITASLTPVEVEIIGESFTPSLLSPTNDSESTTSTLPSFEWEPVPGAENYRITIYNSFSYYFSSSIFSKITEDNTVPASEIIKKIHPSPITAPSTKKFLPFPDTGQNQFFSDTAEIIPMQNNTDYYGQDATYGKNYQSYTAIQSDGNKAFAVSNTIGEFAWTVTAIDSYGNESTPGDSYLFSIVWQMVQDNVTGLTWEVKTRDADSIHDNNKLYTWQEANNFINDLNQMEFGGYSDWRLPTIKELSFIIRESYKTLSENVYYSDVYFPNTVSAPYISSTMLSHYSTPYETDISAWHVDFADGSVFEKNRSLEPVRVRAVRGETVEPYYTDNGDGTVTDTTAKLMWTKEVEGPMTWKEALRYCESLDLIYTDWRLPNRNELQSLVDYNHNASVDAAAIAPVFTESDTLNTDNLPQYYWTSTTPIFKIEDAYIVSFMDGHVTHNNKIHTDMVMVRPVRDVQ